ncbi:MAG TPA: hypothetical protein VGX96_06810 [Candidatus Elarobacter sp.]|jgi:hypothetical protein|nr:hypothetical protein [Candidatus Elarobacter sp.]
MFLSSMLAAAAGTLALATGAPNLPAGPVNVTSCNVITANADGGAVIPASAPYQYGDLRISFVNQAPLAATDVLFAVRYNGQTQIVEDVGTFSTGATVTRDFLPPSFLRYNGAAQCSVEAVLFSDGSSWKAV